MQTIDLEPVKRGFNEIVVFYPQMISQAEMEEFNFRETEISDTDEKKPQKLYKMWIDFLIATAAKMPERLTKDSKKPLPLVEKAGTPEDAIKEYFKEQSPANEKVARWLYIDVANSFVPRRDF